MASDQASDRAFLFADLAQGLSAVDPVVDLFGRDTTHLAFSDGCAKFAHDRLAYRVAPAGISHGCLLAGFLRRPVCGLDNHLSSGVGIPVVSTNPSAGPTYRFVGI